MNVCNIICSNRLFFVLISYVFWPLSSNYIHETELVLMTRNCIKYCRQKRNVCIYFNSKIKNSNTAFTHPIHTHAHTNPLYKRQSDIRDVPSEGNTSLFSLSFEKQR